MDEVTKLASKNWDVIFSKSSCCLCSAMNILFQETGVNLVAHEIDQDPERREMEKGLMRFACNSPVLAVFIGGKVVGSTNDVMSLHLSGSLIPLSKPRHQFLPA
ncbi:Thioredoxin-disulfide reductase [Bertholletia excelsa]